MNKINGMMKIIYLLLISTLFCASCSKPELLQSEPTQNVIECFGLMTADEVVDLRTSCIDSELESKEEIEQHLIGEWSLIALEGGWVGFQPLDACILLTITEDLITILDVKTGEEMKESWELEYYEVHSYKGYYLKTDLHGSFNPIGMEKYCENYMFGSGRTDDGDIYTYEKL